MASDRMRVAERSGESLLAPYVGALLASLGMYTKAKTASGVETPLSGGAYYTRRSLTDAGLTESPKSPKGASAPCRQDHRAGDENRTRTVSLGS
jgi:hypothetical protein